MSAKQLAAAFERLVTTNDDTQKLLPGQRAMTSATLDCSVAKIGLDEQADRCYDAATMTKDARFFSFYFYFADLLQPLVAEEDRLL